jgi:type II restriction/modification system DNA methylase subunit YeeA
VLAEKSIARRESPKVVEDLEKRIKDLGEKRVLETVAYTWFNRFCALRYMDVNRYTRIGILSPADGQFQPEILAEAKMGHIDEELVPEATRKQVKRLLDGSDKSADPQGEAYRLLLVAVCNYYHSLMPFMFEKIADYTELLLPDDLLSGTSLPAYTREALLPINSLPQYIEDFKESVEVIGWLYQFYVADKKDEVFDGLKKGAKITPENIPAATQLFTPHWIVRYLLENSLGRLWMLNHPDSKLVERMEYYIKPEEPGTDFLKISSPEEIKVCDPACGSGHMLTYAFDLLYEIYREEQYPEAEIPTLILRNNLYGIEIDPRAGALAAFALTMKARERDKRFFTRSPRSDNSARDSSSFENPKSKIQDPNICVLENIKIDSDDLSAYMDKVGRDLFTKGLQAVVNQWEEADNFGSLIRPLSRDMGEVMHLLRERHVGPDLFLAKVHQQVMTALRQAEYLTSRYHVVIANPPYMGGSGMNAQMKDFVKKHFPSAKPDLMTCFMQRASEISLENAVWGMINLPSWMYLSSFEEFRTDLVARNQISSLLHLGRGIFGSDFGSVAFVFINRLPDIRCFGYYRRLFERHVEVRKAEEISELFLDKSYNSFRYRQSDFGLVPGTPIAYWISQGIRDSFTNNPKLGELYQPNAGLQTGENARFIREWFEISQSKLSHFGGKKFYPYNKAGGYRKWYGFQSSVVNYENNGQELKDTGKAVFRNSESYFQPSVSWGLVTSGEFGVRRYPKGFIFDNGAPSIIAGADNDFVCGLLNSICSREFLKFINPTLNFQVGNISCLPVNSSVKSAVSTIVGQLVDIAKRDWDASETSWDFKCSPILTDEQRASTLEAAFRSFQEASHKTIRNTQELELTNNKLFVDAFELQSEFGDLICPPLKQITLACNPHYQYEEGKDDSELEELFLADTMRQFVSYAVGCMFGRYSLEKQGLILANQGESAADYRKQIFEPLFAPDEDNVIPILEGEWFSDDISQRFKEFLKITFGAENYSENLKFLENSLYPENPTAKKQKSIRDYFLKDFYDYHLKMYKKRPIYWLFSSPKGTFNALIYMHRYRPETVGKVLECLRDFREKLTHHSEQRQGIADSASESKAEKTTAVKDVAVIKKQLKELEEYEKSLFEVASRMRNVDIDLDNGVKHNYLLFGPVLRKITGLADKVD